VWLSPFPSSWVLKPRRSVNVQQDLSAPVR
jgi:hypothetical protein